MTRLEAHYSARDIEARILAAIRAAGLNPEQRLSHQEVGAPDHFHTGGLSASLELLELAQIRAEEQVLVVGAGLDGCARLLVSARRRPGTRGAVCSKGSFDLFGEFFEFSERLVCAFNRNDSELGVSPALSRSTAAARSTSAGKRHLAHSLASA